ncbi:uncharacterized protein BO66DRAFT_43426 [Aspergillus aculeatinus CBS 121060]|uniref:Uncharacterized protein n=1 Tax=Aspergillus aculeatinus CBS 121060 TaxID=1448322 RepID=A0ACD1HEF4_9EURO|nr:hypothetical protein BO66DRAFT_43426 [Aspergillus aculeatinus CBS 121060]RAH71949.1 hypothetical protein BO66DRAFT_43426 [Aspergillus aculeatinus CBS 121060]
MNYIDDDDEDDEDLQVQREERDRETARQRNCETEKLRDRETARQRNCETARPRDRERETRGRKERVWAERTGTEDQHFFKSLSAASIILGLFHWSTLALLAYFQFSVFSFRVSVSSQSCFPEILLEAHSAGQSVGWMLLVSVHSFLGGAQKQEKRTPVGGQRVLLSRVACWFPFDVISSSILGTEDFLSLSSLPF